MLSGKSKRENGIGNKILQLKTILTVIFMVEDFEITSIHKKRISSSKIKMINENTGPRTGFEPMTLFLKVVFTGLLLY